MFFEYSNMSQENFNSIISTREFPGIFFPFVKSKRRLRNIVLFFTWLFIIDDHNEHSWGDIRRDVINCAKLVKEVEDLIRVKPFEAKYIPIIDKKPYNVFFYGLTMDMFRDMNLVQQKRFVDHTILFVHGCMEETSNLAANYKWKSIEEIMEVSVKRLNINTVYYR